MFIKLWLFFKFHIFAQLISDSDEDSEEDSSEEKSSESESEEINSAESDDYQKKVLSWNVRSGSKPVILLRSENSSGLSIL